MQYSPNDNYECSAVNRSCSDNRIGNEGACALAQSLKQNTTLTKLNLEGKSEFCNNCLQMWDGIWLNNIFNCHLLMLSKQNW